MTRTYLITLVCLAALLLNPLPSSADDPMALLLDKTGTPAPDLELFSELPVDVKLFLLNDSSIEFLHYLKCETVRVVGGTVTVTQTGYTTTGQITKQVRTPCPRKHTVRAAAGQSVETAGVRVRGHISQPISLPQRPNFVLVGRQADTFTAVRIASEGAVVLEVPLQGPRLLWPDTADALEAGGRYEMTLVPSASGGDPMRFNVLVSTAGSGGNQAPLILINVSGRG